MDAILLDNLFVFFAFVYYAELIIVYLLRAHELTRIEWKMSPVFSALLIPFASIWFANIILGNGDGRALAGLPIIIYLAYDLWYRVLTRKKPYHHPERWPTGLIVYVLLLFVASVGLNWYGFLVLPFYGNMLVVAFLIMMGAFGYYQYRYNKKKLSEK
jgi:hypothetical protein